MHFIFVLPGNIKHNGWQEILNEKYFQVNLILLVELLYEHKIIVFNVIFSLNDICRITQKQLFTV